MPLDTADVLIYMVQGSKRFRVAGTELGSPTTVDVVMQPGDAVWVPLGHYHRAEGGPETSVIWSIGFTPPSIMYGSTEFRAKMDAKWDDDLKRMYHRPGGWGAFAEALSGQGHPH